MPIYIAVYAAVIVVCIVLDQLTKIWIFDGLLQSTEGNSVQVLGNFMRFTATYNEGAIFGLMKGRAADIAFFVITVAATPLYVYFLIRSRTRSVWGQIGFAFIVGGALGNAIDRGFVHTQDTFFSGQVRDFISFSIFPPIFNVADSFLTIGVVMAVLAIVVFDPDSLVKVIAEEESAKQAAQADPTETASPETPTEPTDDVDDNTNDQTEQNK